MRGYSTSCLLLTLFLSTSADGQIVIPGADGSDGAFTPGSSVEVDLSSAGTGAWDQPSSTPGNGVYDPDVWAVVFKYTEVNIAAGATVTFKNHPSHAPVVWLVSGDVNITGTVSLNGSGGHGPNSLHAPSNAGPGGFRGGSAWLPGVYPTAGFGPGGANVGDDNSFGSGGSHGTQGQGDLCGSGSLGPTYGSPGLLPLVGGSGGAPGWNVMYTDRDGGGGGGGGAILIAAANSVQIDGQVRANGGNGGGNGVIYQGFCFSDQVGDGAAGAGGGIRIVADLVGGIGTLRARGGNGSDDAGDGGFGRIRVEANTIELVDQGSPPYTVGFPGATAVLFPPTLPTVRITQIDGQPVPSDPRAEFNFPAQDVSIANSGSVQLVIETTNVPTTWTVYVRVVPRNTGDAYTVAATHDSGGFGLSTWVAETTGLNNGFAVLQARAYQP